jgi:hypothetical protein
MEETELSEWGAGFPSAHFQSNLRFQHVPEFPETREQLPAVGILRTLLVEGRGNEGPGPSPL